jgi:uncharacterized protein YutE (UPF0331/DUF86 family)
MTPGSIDLKVVRDRLRLVEQSLVDLRALPHSSLEEFTSDRRNILAADAALRRGLEAIFDVARHLLAKGLGIGKLEYREVARETADHGLVSDAALGQRMIEMAGYRNRLTHHYDEVTSEELFGIVAHDLEDLERLADSLRDAAARLSSAS